MSVRIWTREGNEPLFRNTRRYVHDIPFRPDNIVEGLVTAYLTELNEVQARTSRNPELILGEVKAWDPVRDNRCLYVSVNPYCLAPNGTVLTQYNGVNVHFHKHKRTIDQKWGVDRVEMFNHGKNFVQKAFIAFDDLNRGRSKTGYQPKLVLFDSTGQLDDLGNLANPTQYEDLPTAIIAKERQREIDLRGTETYP